MILFDVTDAARWLHRSGLARVSARLLGALGGRAVPVRWPGGGRGAADWRREAGPGDWFVTAELFSEAERPGWTEFLDTRRCRAAAVFHDAIPLKMPAVTWPASVARHPGYMKLLARFDRVWAVSEASRRELLGFWRWQGLSGPLPDVEVLPLGADFDGGARVLETPVAPARLVSVGIVEPRKNQEFLLDVCEDLWESGLPFELHLVGRINPVFGRGTGRRIARMAGSRLGLRHHARLADEGLRALCTGARAMVLPSLAEGCGLPLLEALWLGLPCVCSDVPALMENAAGGGCVVVARGDRPAWGAALRSILTDDGQRAGLAAAAHARVLPTWAAAADVLERGLVR